MNHFAAQYRRALKRNLNCGGNTRRKLLGQFDLSLAAFSEEHPDATEAELIAAFGSPEEMAQVLTEDISDQVKLRYKQQKKILRIIAAVLVIAFILFTVYVFFCKEIPVEVHDSVFEGTIPTPEVTP